MSEKVIIDENTEWWELLIWETMHGTWEMLSPVIRMKLRKAGNAPSWDRHKKDDEET